MTNITRAELIAECRSIVTGGSPFSADLEVAAALNGAGKAAYFRATNSHDLPDLDALAKPKYEVLGNEGPDKPNSDDGA